MANNKKVPRVAKPAPPFRGTAVVGDKMHRISLQDFRGKYLVLFFYPANFEQVDNTGCGFGADGVEGGGGLFEGNSAFRRNPRRVSGLLSPSEVTAYQDHIEMFKSLSCAVVGCSPEMIGSQQAFLGAPRVNGGGGGVSFPILSDPTLEICRAYDVVLEDVSSQRGPKPDHKSVAVCAVFIIDGKGIIRHMSVSEPTVVRSVPEVIRLVQAFQFHDEYGELFGRLLLCRLAETKMLDIFEEFVGDQAFMRQKGRLRVKMAILKEMKEMVSVSNI